MDWWIFVVFRRVWAQIRHLYIFLIVLIILDIAIVWVNSFWYFETIIIHFGWIIMRNGFGQFIDICRFCFNDTIRFIRDSISYTLNRLILLVMHWTFAWAFKKTLFYLAWAVCRPNSYQRLFLFLTLFRNSWTILWILLILATSLRVSKYLFW